MQPTSRDCNLNSNSNSASLSWPRLCARDCLSRSLLLALCCWLSLALLLPLLCRCSAARCLKQAQTTQLQCPTEDLRSAPSAGPSLSLSGAPTENPAREASPRAQCTFVAAAAMELSTALCTLHFSLSLSPTLQLDLKMAAGQLVCSLPLLQRAPLAGLSARLPAAH